MLFVANKHYPLKTLISESRNSELTPLQLTKIHRELGHYLGAAILGNQPLLSKEIKHVQGTRNMGYYDSSNTTIIVMMRAGLFVAEGIREHFPTAAFILYSEGDKLEVSLITGKKVIVVDSVINSGKTILEVINQVVKLNPMSISIATGILQEKAVSKLENFDMYTIRISENSYVGSGSTDTGDRLFGTIVKE